MRMIDKDALLSDIERTIEESGCVNHEGEIMDCVRYASEVDAVPVVRCRDCKRYMLGPFGMGCMVHFNRKTDIFTHNPDDYCSYGAKMEDKP